MTRFANLVLTPDIKRKLSDLVHSGGPIDWEDLDDHGLFALFDRLPQRHDLEQLIDEEKQSEEKGGKPA